MSTTERASTRVHNVNSVNFNPLASVDDGSCEILSCIRIRRAEFRSDSDPSPARARFVWAT